MSLGGDALEIHVSQKIGKCKVVNEKKNQFGRTNDHYSDYPGYDQY